MMKRGFTLIELSLAVVFVSILSITIALMITDSVRSYRRGMVLNQINTVGMDLTDDIRAAIQNSPSQSVANECATIYEDATTVTSCESDGAAKLVMFVNSSNVTLNGKQIEGKVPVSGAVCFGNYTYMWNSGYFFSDEAEVTGNYSSKLKLKYKLSDGSIGERDDYRLLKVKDELREVCRIAAGNKYNNANTDVVELEEALSEEPIEVLSKEKENNRRRVCIYLPKQ